MGLTEAFGFEERWLRLLVRVVPADPRLLSAENLHAPDGMADSQHKLGGIGNRQVLALRDWAKGIGIIAPENGGFVLSALGGLIARYDPSLEELATSWAIHHSLCLSEDIWFYAHFANAVPPGAFTREDLRQSLAAARKQASSVLEKKALTPLMQTMKGTKLGSELGLFTPLGDDKYERRSPDDRRFDSTLFAFMICDWCAKKKRTTVNLRELTEWGAPGRYLGLGVERIVEMLRSAQERYSGRVLSFSQTAGLNSVAVGTVAPLDVLATEYLQRLNKLAPDVALARAQEQPRQLLGGYNGRLF